MAQGPGVVRGVAVTAFFSTIFGERPPSSIINVCSIVSVATLFTVLTVGLLYTAQK